MTKRHVDSRSKPLLGRNFRMVSLNHITPLPSLLNSTGIKFGSPIIFCRYFSATLRTNAQDLLGTCRYLCKIIVQTVRLVDLHFLSNRLPAKIRPCCSHCTLWRPLHRQPDRLAGKRLHRRRRSSWSVNFVMPLSCLPATPSRIDFRAQRSTR